MENPLNISGFSVNGLVKVQFHFVNSAIYIKACVLRKSKQRWQWQTQH